MEYLHGTSIGSHGRLKSTNVVIDSRWTCKITDYGIHRLLEGEKQDPDASEEKLHEGIQAYKLDHLQN